MTPVSLETIAGPGAPHEDLPQASGRRRLPSPTVIRLAGRFSGLVAGLVVGLVVGLALVSGPGLARAADAGLPKAPPFPVIPTIVVPDIVGVQPAQRAFEKAMGQTAAAAPMGRGIVVTPARCEADRFIDNAGGITRVDGQGEVYRNSRDGVFRIHPDGSGYASSGRDVVRVGQDGEVYIRGEAEADGSEAVVRIATDGSGYYNGRLGTIRLDGKGDGYWSGPRGVIRIDKDGSAYWSRDDQTVRVNADGSGYWKGPEGTIRNDGKGKGYWSRYASQDVPMDPVPRVPPAGRFPAMKGFSMPGQPCGFVITLEDSLLFDFDKAGIRPDAATVIEGLASALGGIRIASMEIRGHTDSRGSDDYNQALSERRARSVLEALGARSEAAAAVSRARARGFGESQPVAPNEIKGEDNPSGRQLNRRVEIYVRT